MSEPRMRPPKLTPKPFDMLEALCVCGHPMREHVPQVEDPDKTCVWSRKLGYTQAEIDRREPCGCAGFVSLLQVAE